MDKTEFYNTIYAILKEVPEGRVITYGWLARLAGEPNQARRVGRALAEAPGLPGLPGLPCHRVVDSRGRTAPRWIEQRRLLKNEGVRFRPNGCVDLSNYGWEIIQSLR